MESVLKIRPSPSCDLLFNKLVVSQSDVRRVLQLIDSRIENELPPIKTLLNRLLALAIDLQNILFTAFGQLRTDATDPTILARVLECYPIARIADRTAA
jgi:hypothetical protein